jgi:hypothetical protein
MSIAECCYHKYCYDKCYYAECHYAECCCFAECQLLSVVIICVVMISVIMLNVIMLSIVMLNVIMLSGVMMNNFSQIIFLLQFQKRIFLFLRNIIEFSVIFYDKKETHFGLNYSRTNYIAIRNWIT